MIASRGGTGSLGSATCLTPVLPSDVMGDTTNLEAVFLENLTLIDRIAAALARRNGFVGEDAVDFASWVKLRMVEDEYAVFRKFRGDSAVGTYLTVVIAMLARDYRVRHFGRWRPSAAARRVGVVAVKLEALVRRQGYRLEQAAEILRTSGDTRLSDRELVGVLAQCPLRPPLRPLEVGAEQLAGVESNAVAEVLVISDETEQERRRVWSALAAAIRAYPVEDRLILRMRFWDELSIADIARALSLQQKSLYRRIDRLLADLRGRLVATGLSADECRLLLSEVDS